MPKEINYILNCVPSVNTENDWTIEDAIVAGAIDGEGDIPSSKDLREEWWKVDNQENTGACVGFAAAYGVLRWHYVKKKMIRKTQKPSARFIWMANKETDNITNYPTTFLERSGTQTKLALRVAQRYGCVLDKVLPMKGNLSTISQAAFYSMASRMRISSYHNLGTELDDWRKWLALNGPILTRLNVDKTWDNASNTSGKLQKYYPDTVRGGHAVCLVGYAKDHFIVRNSWGSDWGDEGFAYASNPYTTAAFTEAYGAVL
ncbi:C1 family peptidase [uncultured Desulfosarcina sp.]|uniref:C1 family peptidase n=1 Tax=uncultured Desulfosarcina sp. TaxID=218289 RepID=UPI0029C8F3CD|nr:C1 family peptidase [uncultured Desulfosarcina sp.]